MSRFGFSDDAFSDRTYPPGTTPPPRSRAHERIKELDGFMDRLNLSDRDSSRRLLPDPTMLRSTRSQPIDGSRRRRMLPKAPSRPSDDHRSTTSTEAQHQRQIVLQQTLAKPPIFSGDLPKPGAGEVTYEEWRYEVEMLLQEDESYPFSYIRKSLRGEARRLTMRCATTQKVLRKLETFYGSVDDGVMLLQKFYSCKQKKGEVARTFYHRLEDLLHRAKDKGEIAEPQASHKMREVFWKGLASANIKATLHHHYEARTPPERLLRLVRELEDEATQSSTQDHSSKTKTSAAVHQQAATTPKPVKVKENKEWICFRCNLPGHVGKGCKNFHLWKENGQGQSRALGNRRPNKRPQKQPENGHLNYPPPLPEANGQWSNNNNTTHQ